MSYEIFTEDVDLFTHLVGTLGSVSACLAAYGLPKHTYYYREFYKACDDIGLSYPKYDRTRKNLISTKIPTQDILTENSTYARGHLKKRLIDEGILENRCYGCELLSEWRGKPITLQLEHKNGINNDNRLENLEMLCPNCHSQTDTYAGRNIKTTKKDRSCLKCGEIITDGKYKKVHTECIVRDYKIDWPPMEELMLMLKKSNYVQVGLSLGVSDNAVRKHIKNHS